MKKLLILTGLLLFIPIFFIPFGGPDGDVFLYIGRLITNGKVPYIDGWDHKGISLYLINALGYGVFGFKSLFGIRLLEFLLISFTFFKLHIFLSKHYSKIATFVAVFLGLITFKYLFDGGNLTEGYATYFSIFSVILLLKNSPRKIDYAIIGALFVISLTLRANLIGLWIALFIAFCFQFLRKEKKLKEIILAFVSMSYGVIAIGSLLAIYLFATGSFWAFIDAAFTFNFSYSKGDSGPLSLMNTVVNTLIKYRFSFVIIVGFFLSAYKVYKKENNLLEILLLFWIPIELILSNVSQKMYAHYFMTWVPLVIFSVILIFKVIEPKLTKPYKKIAIVFSVLFFITSYYSPFISTFNHWKYVINQGYYNRDQKIADHFKKHYPSDSFLVWGNSSYIYNKLNAFTSNPFFYQSTFKINSEVTQKNFNTFYSHFKEEMPKYVLDTRRSGIMVLGSSNLDEMGDFQKNLFKDFIIEFHDNYSLSESKYDVDFYVRKDE